MTTPTNIIDQLKRDEGLRLKPYTDTVGKLTIGVGRNLTDVGISQDEAEFLLANDIANSITDLGNAIPWTKELADTEPVRWHVLINMTFQLGIHGLIKFFPDMLKAIEAGDWQGAATEMLKNDRPWEATARAHRLAQQMTTGEWV